MNNPNEREETRKKNPSISKNYNTNPLPMKKSKSINHLKTINQKTIEKPQGIVKNQFIRKEDENIYAILNTNKDDDFPHLRKLKQSQKEKSLTPMQRNRHEIEVVKNNLEGKRIFKMRIGPTYKANELHLPPMKNSKNFIDENKNKIHNKEISKKSTNKEDADKPIHKNFGKTPEYIQKYKQDAEDKKELM
jgi:hypothetical protein